MSATVDGLPNALDPLPQFWSRVVGRRLAIFLDYDGTLTPIVARPEDARIDPAMRETVSLLARSWPVCVVSGRDRPVVQELMGLHDLVVAGSHGFDIWSPDGEIRRDTGADFTVLLADVRADLESGAAELPGALVEPKAASVALHYRQVAPSQQVRATELVDRVLAEHPGELKVTPGKMVYELQPAIDWDKGKAVRYLIGALGLGDHLPLYFGDDVTDEHAFEELAADGLGIVVDTSGDPAERLRSTAAGYRLDSIEQVRTLLELLAAAGSDQPEGVSR